MAVSEYTHKIAILTRKIWEMDAESLNLEDLGVYFQANPKRVTQNLTAFVVETECCLLNQALGWAQR